MTFAELAVSMLILAVLARVALPVAEVSARRIREWELKASLRELRSAIDAYHDVNQKYPGTLEEMLEKDRSGRKYLRRIPADPIAGKREWFTVSSTDDTDDFIRVFSDRNDVFDVRSTISDKSLEGTAYNEW